MSTDVDIRLKSGWIQENFVFTDVGFVFTDVGYHINSGFKKTVCTQIFPLYGVALLLTDSTRGKNYSKFSTRQNQPI